MTGIAAIAGRELRSCFVTPGGYLIVALFLFLTGSMFFVIAPQLFSGGFSTGQPASLRIVFEVGAWVFFLVGPAVSMRTISEEIRSGTMEALLASPLSDAQIILGKFMGACAILVILLLPTLYCVAALERYGRPDYGEIMSGYLGLLLFGSTCLASGMLFSSTTRSQVYAYLGTVFFWLIVMLLTIGVPVIAVIVQGKAGVSDRSLLRGFSEILDGLGDILAHANPLDHLSGFLVGQVDSASVIYFLSIIIACLAASARSLASRRRA